MITLTETPRSCSAQPGNFGERDQPVESSPSKSTLIGILRPAGQRFDCVAEKPARCSSSAISFA